MAQNTTKPQITAMYIGSFDPFTLGHLSIVNKALSSICLGPKNSDTAGLPLYNKLIICVGNNSKKHYLFSKDQRKHLIELAIKDHPRAKDITVIADDGMTVDIAYRNGVTTLVRGIRADSADLYNEQQLAAINSFLAEMRGFHLKTEFITQEDPFLQTISSSLVRSLYHMDEYISMARCLPKCIAEEIICGKLFEKRFALLFVQQAVIYPYWHQLTEEYSARPYHNMIHLAYMFNQLNIYTQNCSNDKNYIQPNKDLDLAIFLHDYVYDVSSKDLPPQHNESSSADIVVKWEKLRILHNEVSALTVYKLIKTTAHTEDDDLTDMQKLIADLDLSILGTANSTVYKAYTDGIRKEYAAFSDEEYKQGRLHFLFSMLKRKHIFHTKFFRNMLEKQARKNIHAEIKKLHGKA